MHNPSTQPIIQPWSSERVVVGILGENLPGSDAEYWMNRFYNHGAVHDEMVEVSDNFRYFMPLITELNAANAAFHLVRLQGNTQHRVADAANRRMRSTLAETAEQLAAQEFASWPRGIVMFNRGSGLTEHENPVESFA
jgi:hypothetical protein